ncbi:MAG TPA: GIY-YIG nuclease family protein [Candidatus Acidoferrales bacterium]|nr:GIY-YIG nuclease family protein [Candidatus Acidoferrales bacterium]
MAEVKANGTQKEKVVCVGLSQLAEIAALDTPLARFSEFVRAASNQRVGSSNLSGRASFNAMFYVYVLRSSTTGRHYTGFTADLTQRLGQHNAGITKSTKNRGTWTLEYQETYPTRAEAMKREKFLKSGQGREELKRILRQKASVSEAG